MDWFIAVIVRLCLLLFEVEPVRAPPTDPPLVHTHTDDPPSLHTHTDDEDWAESSGDHMIINTPKGERSSFSRHFHLIFSVPFLSCIFFYP